LSTRPGAARVFTDRILREKVNYQFSRALSLRAIVDYSTVDRDSTLSRVDPERRWAMDVLLTYLVNPGTALYLGYRDGYENLAILGTPPTLSRTEDPTTSTGRQLFLKLSYLLQF
jgi:predicted porin